MKNLCSVLIALMLTLQCTIVQGATGNETWQELLDKGEALCNTHKDADAAVVLEKALEVAQASKVEGKDYVKLIHGLSYAYRWSNPSKSEKLMQDALLKYDVAPTNLTVEYAEMLISHSADLDQHKQYYEALGLQTRAYTILEKLYGPDSKSMADICLDLGAAYRRVNDFKTAERNAGRAIAIYERLHTDAATNELPYAFIVLAEAEADQHKIHSAYAHCKRAIYIAECMTFPMHKFTAQAFDPAIELLRRAGAIDKAKHLEWREQKIVNSATTDPNPNERGVDPDNKNSGKWFKENWVSPMPRGDD
jgi:tetratricopeptide (TPR) repeat protein